MLATYIYRDMLTNFLSFAVLKNRPCASSQIQGIIAWRTLHEDTKVQTYKHQTWTEDRKRTQDSWPKDSTQGHLEDDTDAVPWDTDKDAVPDSHTVAEKKHDRSAKKMICLVPKTTEM